MDYKRGYEELRELYLELCSVVDLVNYVVNDHRDQAVVKCGNDCWCYRIEAALNNAPGRLI
jgi:hypothetical protein